MGKYWVTEVGKLQLDISEEEYSPEVLEKVAKIVFKDNTNLQLLMQSCATAWRKDRQRDDKTPIIKINTP
jgi:hypothetical protein